MGENEWGRLSTSSQSHVGIYGWHKRCLYILILSLLLIVIINLTLTLWIIQVLGFNSIGMGDLKLVEHGIQLPNFVYVLGTLITSTIYSYKPMTIDSCHSISINTKNGNGNITNQLYLKDNLLQFNVNSFIVSNKWNSTVFIVDREEVAISSEILSLDVVGGTKLEGFLETPVVEAEKTLRLESSSSGLEISSSAGVSMKSTAGEINLTSAYKIELNSGSLKIESSSVILPGLKDITGNSSGFIGIFQLCVCDNGKLFLGHSGQRCARPEQSVLC